MDLVNFGSKADIKVSSEKDSYAPLSLAISTPSSLDYTGNPDTSDLLSQQLADVQTRFNTFVAKTLGDWLKVLAGKRAITSRYTLDGQVSSYAFGNETPIKFERFANGLIRCSLTLPPGIVCDSTKPVDELKEALGALRTRIDTDLQAALQEYAGVVNLRTSEIDINLLGLGDLSVETTPTPQPPQAEEVGDLVRDPLS